MPREDETPLQAEERRMLAVSSIQALALDYDIGDHEMLKGSILLKVILRTVPTLHSVPNLWLEPSLFNTNPVWYGYSCVAEVGGVFPPLIFSCW